MPLTDANVEMFDAALQQEYTVVDCYGDFCVPCAMLEPIYEAVSYDMHGITFLRVNIMEQQELAERYQVVDMPTLLFFRKGKLVHRCEGSMDRTELLEQVNQMLYGEEDC